MYEISYFFERLEEFQYRELFENAQYPWEVLARVNPWLKDVLKDQGTMLGETRGDCHFEGPYLVGEGTVLHHGACIQGPAILGRGCEVQSGALIRPGTVIGDNCVVGHGSEVKHSVLQNGAKVASLCFVGDSLLGRSARVGSGVIVANRKFNQTNIKAKSQEGRLDTGTDFFGCVLGDSSRIGANSVTQPGTFVGPNTWIYPGTVVRGFLPREKRVYFQQTLAFEDNEIVALKP